MKKRFWTVILTLTLVVAVLAGCGTAGTPPTPTTSGTPSEAGQPTTVTPSDGVTKVKIAVLPYFDYTLFVAAKELGYDKEMGLDFELIPFTLENQAVQALLNGSIDVAQGALGSFVPLVPQAPNLRVIMNNNQYKGFMFVGRKGQMKTFDKLLAENGNDFNKAQEATLKQFKGKKIAMVESSFSSMLKSTLELVGLSYSDVTVMNFQSDAQAATAYMTGECDLYTGGLPQTMALIKKTDEYEKIAGGEVLGAAGLWFSNTAVTQEYLDKNPETVNKLLAIHYKTANMLEKEPNTVLPPMLKYIAENASSDLTIDDAMIIKEVYTDFETLDAAKEKIFNKESPIYWRPAAESFVRQNEALNNIPKGSVNIDEFVVQDKVFENFLKQSELVDWTKK